MWAGQWSVQALVHLVINVRQHKRGRISWTNEQPLVSKRVPYYTEFRQLYWGADKSLARPTSRCILPDGENISFDASLVICINSNNIPPIVIINRVYEIQNLLSL
jgi:hypothetical protein